MNAVSIQDVAQANLSLLPRRVCPQQKLYPYDAINLQVQPEFRSFFEALKGGKKKLEFRLVLTSKQECFHFLH